MNHFITLFMETIVLVLALSIDAFAASFAYGTNKIKIPASSIIIINSICSSILIIFLFIGKAISPFLPDKFLTLISFTILFLLGIVKLFDSSLKIAIRKLKNLKKRLHFSLFHLKFILIVYADPKKADADNSELLSAGEAASLGIALSLDSAAVGFGAGVMKPNLILILILSFFIGVIAIVFGSVLGNKLAQNTSLDLSWLSGVLLIVLAFMKFF